jgi:hypothetical protein|tara:strand:+ start:463 stop:807 length:345 start_codon:yes stop_codon:yes gene_type:complete
MAINYTWDVNTCDVYPTKSGKSNVVHTVHWVLTATDDANNDAEGNPQTAFRFGGQELDISDLSSFTNWSSLDAATVQGWVEAALGADRVTEIKSQLNAQITEKVTPTSVKKTLG